MLVHVLVIRVPAVVCEEVKEDGNPVLSMDDPELEAGLRLQNRKSKALKQCVLHPPPHDSELRWKNPADEPGTSPRARQRDDPAMARVCSTRIDDHITATCLGSHRTTAMPSATTVLGWIHR